MVSNPNKNKQLTSRSIVIGCIGSAILTASSLYMALKMGALPWPIVFAALASVVCLRALGSNNLHEANVTHAAMSAGSMIAGGLAFTIPAMWMSDASVDISVLEVLVCAICGCSLGLSACAKLQPYFIVKKDLPYPIGVSASDTLKATNTNNAKGAKALFGGMGLSAVYAVLRDNLSMLPSVLFGGVAIPNVAFGLINSPMICALGYMIGGTMALVWFIGAVVGNFGIAYLFPILNICDIQTADAIRTSLGLGLMLGVGAGIIILHSYKGIKNNDNNTITHTTSSNPRVLTSHKYSEIVISILVALTCTYILHISLVASVILVAAIWFCVYLAAWLTGTTGVNPMEIFGVVVLLLIQLLFVATPSKTLFLCASITAVACGIAGDVMNDLKAGDQLKTNPKDQFIGMCAGSAVGVIVASFLIVGMFKTYGAASFGPDGQFVSAQACVVSVMAGGIPHTPAFIVGIALGITMACLKLPVMTLGLGVYLPFYLSATAALGALIKVIADRRNALDDNESKALSEAKGQIIASGILGGESLVGVITALIALGGAIF